MHDEIYGTATVGERGQIVIPAGARRAYDINPGDKILVFGLSDSNGLVFVKISNMTDILSGLLTGENRVRSGVIPGPEDLESPSNAR